MSVVIAVEDPRVDDVRELLERHLRFAREVTPPGHVFALDVERSLDPHVTLFGVRRDGALLAIGALKHLDHEHAEIKAMHTAEAARRQGIGRMMLDHLMASAAEHGYRRVSLETGTMDAFAAARDLYAAAGFRTCAPFGSYASNPHSSCMTIELDGHGAR